jgi:hypothetical protein
MPHKHDSRRQRNLEKKKRKKKLRNKKRKLARTKQNKIENIKGQMVESISPTFDRSGFTENNNTVKQSDVLKKPMGKLFNKSAWKPDDGQEK